MTDIVAETVALTRAFGTKVAVDQVDLAISRGTIFGLLGPNGSGKTTMMRMLTGLLRPTGGQATVLGTSLPGNAEPLKRRIGYMTQGFTHYRDLTVLENLRFVADIHALPRPEKQHRIEELVEVYELGDQAHQLAGEMSGGQRQRLALAATVLHRPELLFLDEPTSSVDPGSRRDFWEKLFDLVDVGTTMVVSTHLMDEAERCHRIAILDRGRKRSDGAPRDLMAQVTGRVIEIENTDLRGAARDLLDASDIVSVAQIGARLRVIVSDTTEDPISCVAGHLRDFPDAHFGPSRPNLEDVFAVATQE